MRRFRRTTLIAVFCIAVLAGLGLSKEISWHFSIWLLLLLPVVKILRHKNRSALIVATLLGLSIGLWRGSAYINNYYQLKSFTGQNVTIQATATADAIYANKSQLEFTASKINLVKPMQERLAGTFKLSGFGVKMIYRGDRVQVVGKLYPTRGANQARIAYGQLSLISSSPTTVNKVSRNFNAGLQSALPEPLASFGLGLLIGQRSTLPANILQALTAVGLIHIVAVSGYNLTILIRAVGRLKLGSKYQRLVLSLSLIVLFVAITGFSASIIRAAIVSTLSLLAWYFGLRFRPITLIALAAAITAFWNPFYVWGDMSWYLSFLAFFGVLVIAPIISARLFSRPPKILTSVIIETLSAEIMTLPLIMMSFGQLSLISLLANTLIVPLVPLAMLLSALAGLAGAIMPALAGWVAWPATPLLTYMLDIVHILSSSPSVLVKATISLTAMLCLYMIAGLVVVIARHKSARQPEQLHVTP